MKTNFILLPMFFVLFIGTTNEYSQAQVISPVSSQTFLFPPYLHRLQDWIQSPENKIELRLRLLDASVSNAGVCLRMKLFSNNLQIENPTPIPQIFYLNGNENLILNAADLWSYFSHTNLRLSGSDQNDFIKNGGQLPDGIYHLSFEVYEARSGNKVSFEEIPAIFSLLSCDPPILNTPFNESTVLMENIPLTRFQWTPRHWSAKGFVSTEYTFEIAEIPESFLGDWQQNFNSLPLILKENTTQCSFSYGMELPLLKPGNRYAFRVKASCQNRNGESLLFKNNGYSEVFSFVCKENCTPVSNVQITAITSCSASLNWSNQIRAEKYKIYYRKGGIENAQWFIKKISSDTLHYALDNLEAATAYECKIGTICAYSESDPSNTYHFTTLSSENTVLQCGNHNTNNTNTQDQSPLFLLQRFDKVQTKMGFAINIEEVSGENGYFSGSGYTHIPLLANTGIKVKFKHIFVNKNYELVSGKFEASSSKKKL
ncbi:MAG: fibronectin type III domain-containing protein [Bacteroidales bacterium]